jgi:hypothetical protein
VLIVFCVVVDSVVEESNDIFNGVRDSGSGRIVFRDGRGLFVEHPLDRNDAYGEACAVEHVLESLLASFSRRFGRGLLDGEKCSSACNPCSFLSCIVGGTG